MRNCTGTARRFLLTVFTVVWILAKDTDVFAQFVFSFAPSQGVWDVTGHYSNNEFDTTNNIDLIQDDKGKITGTGTATDTDTGITVNLTYLFSGAIKTVSDLTRVTLIMKISGTATDGVVTLPVKGNVRLTLDLDKVNNLLIGSGAGNICVQGRCAKVEGPVQFDIPQPMDGSWTLALDYQILDAKKIQGTAAGTLSNGRVIPLSINGYVTSQGLRLNLKGTGGTITFSPPGSHALGLFVLTRAKLLGQTVPTSP